MPNRHGSHCRDSQLCREHSARLRPNSSPHEVLFFPLGMAVKECMQGQKQGEVGSARWGHATEVFDRDVRLRPCVGRESLCWSLAKQKLFSGGSRVRLPRKPRHHALAAILLPWKWTPTGRALLPDVLSYLSMVEAGQARTLSPRTDSSHWPTQPYRALLAIVVNSEQNTQIIVIKLRYNH